MSLRKSPKNVKGQLENTRKQPAWYVGNLQYHFRSLLGQLGHVHLPSPLYIYFKYSFDGINYVMDE